MKYAFTLFALGQGCLVLGLTLFIFWYYLPKNRSQLKPGLRWHVLTVALSYMCLTLATIRTASEGMHSSGDIWYWIVVVAYISGDIALLHVFKAAVVNHKLKQKENERAADVSNK